MSIKNCRFDIDFSEFSFLVEACIPPRPIARTMFWHDVINVYYDVLTQEERSRLYNWIRGNPQFNINNIDCAWFEARYNPDNQYIVKYNYNNETKECETFKFNNRYYTLKGVSINDDYIIDIKKNDYEK